MWCLESIRAPRAFSWGVLGGRRKVSGFVCGRNVEGGEEGLEGNVLNVFHFIFADIVA